MAPKDSKISMTNKNNDDMIAHLGMIQGVINRLASNSTSMKSMSGTIAAAAIALYGTLSNSQSAYLLGATLAIIIFWIMDARYLRLERAYRTLYDHVRKRQNEDTFGMDYKPFLLFVPSTLQLFFSWSLLWFYGAIVVVFAGIEVATVINCLDK